MVVKESRGPLSPKQFIVSQDRCRLGRSCLGCGKMLRASTFSEGYKHREGMCRNCPVESQSREDIVNEDFGLEQRLSEFRRTYDDVFLCQDLVTDSDVRTHHMKNSLSKAGTPELDTAPAFPAYPQSFAQAVSRNCSCAVDPCLEDSEEPLTCWEVVEDSHPETDSAHVHDEEDADASTDSFSVDTSDERYLNHLEFAIKCGYSESDLLKAIARFGLDCDKNSLLQELVKNSSGSEGNEEDSPDDMPSSDDDDDDVDDDDDEGGDGDVPSSKTGISEAAVEYVAEQRHDEGEKEEKKAEEKGDGVDVDNLRPIIIDGSNVAMSHGKNVFSCRGIQLAVDWFQRRGHCQITVFVPQWRKEAPRHGNPITDQYVLQTLEEQGLLTFTPSRWVNGRLVVCYDDRFMLQLAAESGGVVVSNDTFRDLVRENPQGYRAVVEERLLMFTFVNDRFMAPEDPLGRRGPTLDNFLRKQPAVVSLTGLTPCPYGRKCSYGPKCKYSHPERGPDGHKMVSEVLKEQASRKMKRKSAGKVPPRFQSGLSQPGSLGQGDTSSSAGRQKEARVGRTDSRSKSPPKSLPMKNQNYLSEHRRRLEQELTVSYQASSYGNSALHSAREMMGAGLQPDGSLDAAPQVCPQQPFTGPPELVCPVNTLTDDTENGLRQLARALSHQVFESGNCLPDTYPLSQSLSQQFNSVGQHYKPTRDTLYSVGPSYQPSPAPSTFQPAPNGLRPPHSHQQYMGQIPMGQQQSARLRQSGNAQSFLPPPHYGPTQRFFSCPEGTLPSSSYPVAQRTPDPYLHQQAGPPPSAPRMRSSCVIQNGAGVEQRRTSSWPWSATNSTPSVPQMIPRPILGSSPQMAPTSMVSTPMVLNQTSPPYTAPNPNQLVQPPSLSSPPPPSPLPPGVLVGESENDSADIRQALLQSLGRHYPPQRLLDIMGRYPEVQDLQQLLVCVFTEL